MYHRTLRVGLFGVADEAALAIQGVEPPERFELAFVRERRASTDALRSCDIAVIDNEARAGLSLPELHAAVHGDEVGYKAIAIMADAVDAAAWGSEDYAAVEAVWPRSCTAQRVAFEFSRLLDAAKDEADLYITNAYLDALIDSAPEMIWFKALDGCHLKVNEYFCEICDKPREAVTNKYHNYIWSVPEEDWDKAELTCKVSEDETIAKGCTCQFLEHVSTHGEIRLFDTYKTPIYDEDGSVLGTSGFAHDITAERELQDLAWRNARIDYLTGLWNRRYLYEYLEEHADEGPMTFVLVDLDNFKEINDSSGHDEGDNALLVTTGVLHKCFPDCPVVRWGGDEFIVIVPQGSKHLAEDASMDAFQEMLKRRTAEKCPIALSASVGIAEQYDGADVDQAIKFCDEALYRAKAAGKARLVRHEL